VGWHYGYIHSELPGRKQTYTLGEKLAKGTEITITLAWNRDITFTENIALGPLGSDDRIFHPFGEDLNTVGYATPQLDLSMSESKPYDFNRDGDFTDTGISEDLDGDGVLDEPDAFGDNGRLVNLDLFLYRSGQVLDVRRSFSSVDSVEHMLFTIPEEDVYRIEVKLTLASGEDPGGTEYGLAWHATAVPEPASLTLLIAAGWALLRKSRR